MRVNRAKMFTCIRMCCVMKIKLRKLGPSFEDRTLNQIRYSFINSIVIQKDTAEARSKHILKEYILDKNKKNKCFTTFLKYHERIRFV